jgi:peptidoglycan/LPS O-acetylase OafA/YrhL
LPIIGIIPALLLVALAQSMHLPRFSSDYQGITIDSLLYVNPAARLFEFTLGMATACLYSKYKSAQIDYRMGTLLELLGVGLFAASLSLNADFFENGFLSQLFPSSLCVWLERCGVLPLFAAIILIFAFQKGAVSLILRQGFYVRAGEISYAIYILHPVILSWVTRNLAPPPSIGYATYLGLTLWASYLSWRYIEGPARAWITKERARAQTRDRDTSPLAWEGYQPLSRVRTLWYRLRRRTAT